MDDGLDLGDLLLDCLILQLLESLKLPLLLLFLQLIFLLLSLCIILGLSFGGSSSSRGSARKLLRWRIVPLSILLFEGLLPFLFFVIRLGFPLQVILGWCRTLNLREDPVHRLCLPLVGGLQKLPVDDGLRLPLVPGFQSGDELVNLRQCKIWLQPDGDEGLP